MSYIFSSKKELTGKLLSVSTAIWIIVNNDFSHLFSRLSQNISTHNCTHFCFFVKGTSETVKTRTKIAIEIPCFTSTIQSSVFHASCMILKFLFLMAHQNIINFWLKYSNKCHLMVLTIKNCYWISMTRKSVSKGKRIIIKDFSE